ncbi:4718_t:CDS:2 [Dentiscutata erythropus]|uniref:4718_t:CDS:1 n=1 Tax=Dentiscutata erythropus TaxID=1348616 RepID=A0A9N9C7D7_9GLOM|nr:4718_t:CDS:2 [Dentiscutata erythropus]
MSLVNEGNQFAFRQLLNYIKAGFYIPCEQTAKKIIDKAYDWSWDQLFDIMNTNDEFVNLMMNIWSSKTNQRYIGVMATWIDSAFKLKETLLTIQLLFSPHIAEAIANSLNQVITDWELTDQIFCIITNNGANVKKMTGLMNNNQNGVIDLMATNIFSGSSYPTLNFIYPTIRLLIGKFVPFPKQTEEDYAELLFKPIGSSQPTNDEDHDKLDIKDEFDTLIISEQLCQPLKPSVELDKSPTMLTLKPATTNNLIAALYNSEEPNNEVLNKTEVHYYLREPFKKIGYNPLVW